MLFALCVGSFVQGAIGFAFGIVALPILLWAGVPLSVSVAVLLSAVVTQCATGAWRFRSSVVWGDVLPMFGYRVVAMPVGVALLALLDGMGLNYAKAAVGAVVLAAVLANAVFRPAPRERVHRAWTPAVGLSSGVLAGALGIGGPPVVLWVGAHDWPTRRTRVFLWVTFGMLTPVQLSVMGWRFGWPVLLGVAVGLASTPVVVLAGKLGADVGDRFSRRQLRGIAYVLLAAVGVGCLLSPVLGR